MNILLFVVVPILCVTAYAIVVWARNRQPTSVESGVDAFRREMSALSPDAAPVHRRPERGVDPGPTAGSGGASSTGGAASSRTAPRRPAPGAADAPAPDRRVGPDDDLEGGGLR